MYNQSDLRKWLEQGQMLHATHMLVLFDTVQIDGEEWLVVKQRYVLPVEDIHVVLLEEDKEKSIAYEGMYFPHVSEVYNFTLPLEEQIEEQRAYHP